MKIEKLVLTDFRNYERLVWSPQSRLVVLTGENGAGKTNLLEAISLLAPGRGLRAASNSQILRQDASSWGIVARLNRNDSIVDLATGSDPANPSRRVFQLDGMSVRAQSQVASSFSSTWLTPQMDRLFVDPASGRRRFLDRLVLAFDPNHARESASHERSVTQRNRLLATRPDQTAWLDAIEDSIARHAVALTASRMALLAAMNNVSYSDTKPFPATRLRLECALATKLHMQSALQVEDDIRFQLRNVRSDDRERGATSIGAHRTDLSLEDHKTGRPAFLSSSGQQKAMLVHVILTHASLMSHQNMVPPVVLLDEPLVHLDERRRDALLGVLRERDMVTFLTGTDYEQFSDLGSIADHRHVVAGALFTERP